MFPRGTHCANARPMLHFAHFYSKMVHFFHFLFVVALGPSKMSDNHHSPKCHRQKAGVAFTQTRLMPNFGVSDGLSAEHCPPRGMFSWESPLKDQKCVPGQSLGFRVLGSGVRLWGLMFGLAGHKRPEMQYRVDVPMCFTSTMLKNVSTFED